MKKYIPYILICMLLIIISSGITYLVMDKNYENKTVIEKNKNNKDSDKNENLKDKITLIETKKNNNKIIQEYEIVLNNQKNNLKVEYEYKKLDETAWNVVSAKISENQYISFDITSETEFNKEKINDKFNEKNFQIIKGEDNKNYLGIVTLMDNAGYLYIYNDKLEILDGNSNDAYKIEKGFTIHPFTNTPCKFIEDPTYKNNLNFKVYDQLIDKLHLKIEENKIYYLATVTDSDENNYNNYYLEERVYKINNNKIKYEVLNKYKIIEFCQQGPW